MKIPESTKSSLSQRLSARARERWPGLKAVKVRFRSGFAYVDGQVGEEVTPLCRLRYGGSASRWGFAIYLASKDGYEDSVLPSGACWLARGSPRLCLRAVPRPAGGVAQLALTGLRRRPPGPAVQSLHGGRCGPAARRGRRGWSASQRAGDGVVTLLEAGQCRGDGAGVEKVVRGQDFSLYDGEVDLRLVKPGGVDGQVDKPQRGPLAFKTVYRSLAPVAAAEVDDPEDPLGAGVGLGRHDLLDQAAEGGNAGRLLATAEDLCPVHVVGSHVGDRPFALVLVLDPQKTCPPRWQAGVATAAGLDARLFISADDELFVPEGLALEDPGVQVEHPRRLGREVRVAGKIHIRWHQGRMASLAKVRQTVAAEMKATMPRRTSSRASSVQLQRESGTPVVAGSSHARTFTSATTWAPNVLGRPGRSWSFSPSRPCSQNRLRQRWTTWVLVPTRSAISLLAIPSAAKSTTLARTTCQYGAV